MTISEEIINLVKIKLVSGQHKVNIATVMDGNEGSTAWVKNTTHRNKNAFPGGSIMVWGCISQGRLIMLRKIEGKAHSILT